LTIIKEQEAGLKDRQAIDRFKQGQTSDDDGEGSSPDIKALQKEAEAKYGRWQG
jgi:hypothetical protein